MQTAPLYDTNHTHTHTHTRTHAHTHAEDVFLSEENLTTMISTQMAADIMNWAFQTEFCIFKVKVMFKVFVPPIKR